MPPRRRSSRNAPPEPDVALFRGGEEDDDADAGNDVRQVETDLGLASTDKGAQNAPAGNGQSIDVDMEDAAAPSGNAAEPHVEAQVIDLGGEEEEKDIDMTLPQTTTTTDEQKDERVDKGKVPSTVSRDALPDRPQGGLLASIPVYLNASTFSSSSLQVFQFPTYPKNKALLIPQSARERGLQPAMRTRPRAKRVELELPLDQRPGVYDSERGEEFGEGAQAAGPIGPGPVTATTMADGPSSIRDRRIKSEYGGFQTLAPSTSSNAPPRQLERTRLESALLPHQTQYMVGVMRNRAIHLTPVESMHQLRPSMHYLDALDAMKKAKERLAVDADNEDEGGGATAAPAASARPRKTQNLNVSIRNEGGMGPGGGPGSGGGAHMGADGRETLMRAEREAESEAWINLDWYLDPNGSENRKAFESHLFATNKTPLQCQTKPREYLKL